MKTRVCHALVLASALGLGLALPLGAVWGHRASTAATVAASPAIEARLIVRPHTIRLAITLARGVRLEGTLAPGLPGPNMVSLVAQPGSIAGNRLNLEATMPGMIMAPATATLTARGHAYRGMLTLPMFGRYRLRVTLVRGHLRSTGAIGLPLLPSWRGLRAAMK